MNYGTFKSWEFVIEFFGFFILSCVPASVYNDHKRLAQGLYILIACILRFAFYKLFQHPIKSWSIWGKIRKGKEEKNGEREERKYSKENVDTSTGSPENNNSSENKQSLIYTKVKEIFCKIKKLGGIFMKENSVTESFRKNIRKALKDGLTPDEIITLVKDELGAQLSLEDKHNDENVEPNEKAKQASVADSEPPFNTEHKRGKIIKSGIHGTCSWEIDSFGLLRIFPTDGKNGTLDSRKSFLRGESPWREFAKKIKNVVVDEGVVANRESSNLFNGLYNCEEIDLSGLDTRNIEVATGMFWGCASLKKLILTRCGTSNVVDMSYLFYGCNVLESVNLSGFDTRNVINMSYMFAECEALKMLDLRNFNTRNVVDMSSMFSNCESLESANLGGFDTKKVTSMTSMFEKCENLKKVNLNSFTLTRDTDISYMFFGCRQLEDLGRSSFDVSNIKQKENIFLDCNNKITEICKAKK